MTDTEEDDFINGWAHDAQQQATQRLATAGRRLLQALEGLDDALGQPKGERRDDELRLGSAGALAALIVQYFGPAYAHDVVAPDIQDAAHLAGG